MRKLTALALCAGLVAMRAGSAGAEVRVTFVAPEHYTDASLYDDDSGAAGLRPALHGVEKILRRLGEQYLRPNQTLVIEVLDIDLAGALEPRRVSAQEVRVMRDVTWPRIKLRYSLTQAGQPLRAAEEEVSDQSYLIRAGSRSIGDTLPYERTMLEDWFRVRFGENQTSQR